LVGLLRSSFRPPGAICAIRSLWRHRASLIQMAAEHVLHMQKALDQMNVQIHRVLNDITGVSGLKIIDAILAGERDPLTMARLRHGGVKNSEDTIAKSLEGDYRPEQRVTVPWESRFHLVTWWEVLYVRSAASTDLLRFRLKPSDVERER